MKPRTSFFAVSFSLGLLALTFSGCESLANRRTPDASRPIGGKSLNILTLRDNVKSTRLALNRTLDTLNRVPGSPAAHEAFNTFSMELSAFNKLADQTLKESDNVRNRGRELFAEWSAETESINDPEIRAIAEERRTTLMKSYNSMLTPHLTARSELSQTRSDLTDIQKALALDLTPDGVNAIKGSINRINGKASTTVRSLDALASELDAIADVLPSSTMRTAR